MKKFVSIVLALALALSLCTVAFAVSSSTVGGDVKETTVSAKGYSLYNMDNSDSWKLTSGEDDDDAPAFVQDGITEFKLITTSKKVVTEDDETTTYYYADLYKFADDFFAVSVDDSIANYKLVKDGKVVAYLLADFRHGLDEEAIEDCYFTDEVVDKVVEGSDDPDCGEYNYDGDVYVIDGDGFAAVTFTGDVAPVGVAMLNGKLVAYGAEVFVKEHTLTGDKTYTTDGDVATVKCADCGKVIKLVTSVPAASVDKYVKAADYGFTQAAADDNVYYFLSAEKAASAATTSTTTVDSSKTFDAGVAMYVGLSLMSVAGSAVVIGKKKEF